MTEPQKHSVSFVIPCLNEAGTLREVLGRINKVCENDLNDRQTEVIVSDNGSTDNSVTIAESLGARVVHCSKRGYGAALIAGIESATCQAVVFADADNTYDFLEAPRLIAELDRGYDFVVGSRMDGQIHPGAMPFMHRYVGTPVLNFFLNLLYARGDNKVTDCNSGFRCFLRHSFISWGVTSTGMEFASEMLVKALKAGAKMSHVPVSLHPDTGDRAPHLQRWRDGMRHLLQIFFDSPEFFCAAGSTIFLLGWLILLVGLFCGHMKLGFVWVFGLHSMMFGLLGGVFGIIVWSVGLFLAARVEAKPRIYRYLIDLTEDKLFWYSIIILLFSFAMFGAIVVYWAAKGFHFIEIERQTLVVIAFASNSLVLVSNVVTAHLLKRS